MVHSWLTLAPPLVVVITTFITHHIHAALLLGILTAGYVASEGYMNTTGTLIISAIYDTVSSLDTLYLFGFLVGIGMLVSLLTVTGFATSFAHAIAKKIKNIREAEYACLIISVFLLIDDYLSILTVGHVMSPIIDRFYIAREKLAFLLHSFAGPVVILIPISSWAALINTYLENSGVSLDIPSGTIPLYITADPFYIYLKTLPYLLYSFITLVSVLYIVHARISFGPMKRAEQKARAHSHLSPSLAETASMGELLLPIVILLLTIAVGLPCAGGYWLFGGNYTLLESIKYNPHPFLIMLIAVITAIGVTLLQAWYKKALALRELGFIVRNSITAIGGAITMVFLASVLSTMLANYVGTGQYIATIFSHAIPDWLLPAMFFITSLVCTIATGSAWGNFALMIPIAIPMIAALSGKILPVDPHELPLLLPILGAIFSGSVCGDHNSPLSDTMTMTAISTHTTVITHTGTQIFYTLPTIASCIVGYLIIGILHNHVTPWLHIAIATSVSISLCLTILWISNRKS
jgi:tetracycline resistance efflux pump